MRWRRLWLLALGLTLLACGLSFDYVHTIKLHWGRPMPPPPECERTEESC